MAKRARIPQAPSDPLPELDESLKPFRITFRRRESQAAMERYLTVHFSFGATPNSRLGG